MKIRKLGHVVLYVTDLEKVAGFYRDILGFREIARAAGAAVFSSGRTHHEFLLIEVGGEPVRRAGLPAEVPPSGTKAGLYHIGFKIADSVEELKEVWRELKAKEVMIVGTGDHGVTHSIYILDPDGNELELYADVSDEWKTNPKALMTPVRPLDLD